MLTNEPERQEVQDPSATITSRELIMSSRDSLIEALVLGGCRREINGDITRVIGSGDGLVIKEPVLRRRFRQGV